MISATSNSTAPDRRCIHGLLTWWVVVVLGCGLASALRAQTDRTWSLNANGNWNSDANWGGNRPNSATERAVLNQATGYTITFNASNTVGGILFNGTGGYTISRTGGGTTLTLDQYGVNTTSSANQIITGPNLRLTLGNNTFFGVNSSGNLTISTAGGSIATTATRNITFNGTGTGTGLVSSVISGAGNLLVSGSANWTLSGANTLTGNTTLTSGNLTAGHDTAFGTGNIIFNGGALSANATRTLLNNATISASSTIGGANAITLGNATRNLTNTGNFALTVNNSGGTTIAGNVALSDSATNRTLTVNGTGNLTISGVISNGSTSTSSLAYSGSGNLTLSGVNTYSGNSTLTSGTVVAANDSAFGASNIIFNGGTLTADATRTLLNTATLAASSTIGGSNSITLGNATRNLTNTGNFTLTVSNSGGTTLAGGLLLSDTVTDRTLTLNGSGPLTVSGNITNGSSAASNLIYSGSSTLTLSGTNTYNSTTISSGSLQVGAGGTTGTLGSGAVANSGNLTFNRSNSYAVSNLISGTGNVTQAGSGTTTLSGANTYTGNTTVTAGTLAISSEANLGANPGAFNAAQLTLNGGTLNTTATFSIDDSNRGITIGAGGGTFNTDASTTLTIDNPIAGAGALTKAGSGNIVLTGANTYGATTISAGNLQVGSGGTTGTLGSGAVANSGNLTFNRSNSYSVTNVISGTGNVTQAGSGTTTLSGANTYTGNTTVSAGTLAISSEANLGANPGAFNAAQLTLNGGTLNTTATFSIDDSNRGITIGAGGGTFNTDASTTLTVANPMAGSGNLTKSGTGNIVFSASSASFTGAVTINAGTATLSHSNAIGGGTANTTVDSGAALTLQGGIGISKGTLYLSGTGVSNSGALVSATGNNSWNGNITLNGNTTIKTNSAGVDYLDLGTFQPLLTRPPVDATTTSLGSHTLTLAGGTGTSEIYLNGRITGTGGLTVNMTNTGDTVYLSSHLNTFTGTTEIKNGTLVPATLPNTYPFDNSGGGGTDQYYGLNGPVTIGDGTGAANSAVLRILNNGTRFQELINHTVPITLHKDGLFEVGSAQSIGTTDVGINPLGQSLIFNGGNVSIGTNGLLYLAGDVKVNATAGQTAVIDGVGNTLSLTIQKGVLNNPPNADRVFDVVGGVGNTSDLTINATIKNGSITKNGAGTMTITGNNAAGYEGTTTINNGIVAITNNGSLGQGLTNNASATIVNSGGTLQLSNGITVSNEWLRLNGNGYNSNGALLNLSGTNTWAGSIFLDSDARIQSDAGLLTISGTTTSATNANLDVRGSGNTTISGAIGTGSGGVTKNGTGTLTLSGVNTYSGATTVSQGVVSLQSSSGLGAAGTGTTVASGAELQLDNTAIGGGSNVLTTLAEPLTIAGSGVTSQGALRSVSGPNVFAGQVTIGTGGATVTANNGHSLTLSGGTTSSNHNLTVGTSAENGNITISGDMTNGTGSLIKAGTGSLTIASASTQSASVGQVQLNAGSITVGGGGGNSTLNATDFDSAGSTTLTIASGGLVNVTQAAGTTSTFAGAMAGSGEFKFNGTANFGTPASSSILALSSPFTASSLTLTLNGGLLSLTGVGQYEFGTIHITGNTILDFNNSAGTWLRSAALVIDGGVTITVRNWTATAGLPGSSTVWYATSTINAGSLGAPPTNQVGGTPLNQITFDGWNATAYPTTWVNTAQNGWFDREIRPTPEPSTYGALLLTSCLGLLGWRRYRAGRKTSR